MSTVNVNKVVDTSGGVLAPISSVFRNRIFNGNMSLDQRNAGASVTPNNAYTLDRWLYENVQTGKVTIQQDAGAVTPPIGFNDYLGVTSTSAYSVLTGDTFLITQRIEGYNVADFAWGTANAQTVTLSFWVRSSLTGTFGGAFGNVNASRSYPFSYTISAANTWEQKTITVVGDTSGTWNKTNGRGLTVTFGLGSGSTFTSTAGSWQAGNFVQPTGSVSVVGTSGATFYITGVQLEKGSTATSFDYRSIGTELALCQRYYQINDGYAGICNSTSGISSNIIFITTMRSNPTIGQTAVLTITDTVADYTQSSTNITILTGVRVTTNSVQFASSNFSGLTNIRPMFSIPNTTGKVTLSAEL
jgi:hypothetical protein